jgi:hypothetical protein
MLVKITYLLAPGTLFWGKGREVKAGVAKKRPVRMHQWADGDDGANDCSRYRNRSDSFES